MLRISLHRFAQDDSARCEMNCKPVMSSAPFEMPVSVVPGDIDEQNHVNNTVYLRWVQDVATAHWRAVASLLEPELTFLYLKC